MRNVGTSQRDEINQSAVAMDEPPQVRERDMPAPEMGLSIGRSWTHPPLRRHRFLLTAHCEEKEEHACASEQLNTGRKRACNTAGQEEYHENSPKGSVRVVGQKPYVKCQSKI